MKNSKDISFVMLLLMVMSACSSSPAPAIATVPTSVPLATALSSPTPNSILFEDSEFTNSCTVDSTADVERFVENGQFNMRVLTPFYAKWTKCTKVEYADFILEVDATQVSGPDDNSYGVIFRYGINAGEFYAFLISGDGFYVFTVDGAEREDAELLVDWTQSPVIKQGAQTNHIKIVAVGENMKYYVNDQFLGEVQDARFGAGVVGFFTGTLAQGGVQISFDNLKISKP